MEKRCWKGLKANLQSFSPFYLFILCVTKQYVYPADCYTLVTQNNLMHPHVHKMQLQRYMALALLNTVNMERVPLELGPRQTPSNQCLFQFTGHTNQNKTITASITEVQYIPAPVVTGYQFLFCLV